MKLSYFAFVAVTSFASAQTVAFSDDFSAGLGNWIVTGLWHQTTGASSCDNYVGPLPDAPAVAFNGTTSSNCGFFTAAYGDLTTIAPIAIPAGAVDPRLRFTSYEETECGGPNCGWDERWIYVSADAGANWTQVFAGYVEYLWYEQEVSLAAFAGQSILIRFRFDPVDTLWNNFPGWYVDDVRVEYDAPFDLYCTAKTTSNGCVPAIDAIGDVSLSGPDDLVISGRLLRDNVYSKLIWSRGSNNAPWGGGTLCVQAPAARTTVLSSLGQTGSDCSGTYSYAFTHAYLASKNVLAGETLYVQCSTRDPGYTPPQNHSLSNALSFTVLP